MKKKKLEIELQKVPSFSKPVPHLEQYLTPATVASDIIFIAYQFGDIEDKIVIDLGCGTGIFSVGAYLLGAKKIIGVDVDKNCITTAKEYANKNNFEIEFKVQDIQDVNEKCDTIVMNPPFGAQKSNLQADRRFIEKGSQSAGILYSLHLTKTVPFIEKLIAALTGEITYQKEYSFPIKWMFSFHQKEVKTYEVTLLRIETNK